MKFGPTGSCRRGSLLERTYGLGPRQWDECEWCPWDEWICEWRVNGHYSNGSNGCGYTGFPDTQMFEDFGFNALAH